MLGIIQKALLMIPICPGRENDTPLYYIWSVWIKNDRSVHRHTHITVHKSSSVCFSSKKKRDKRWRLNYFLLYNGDGYWLIIVFLCVTYRSEEKPLMWNTCNKPLPFMAVNLILSGTGSWQMLSCHKNNILYTHVESLSSSRCVNIGANHRQISR